MSDPENTVVLHAFRDPLGVGAWLALECGHWYHWTGARGPEPRQNAPFRCPDCTPLPVAVPIADPAAVAVAQLAFEANIRQTMQLVEAELRRACAKHPSMMNGHYGYAVILEELDELKEHVWNNTPTSIGARSEAIQVAAMGARYAMDLCGQDGKP